jgi:hypothetical protein
MPRAGSPDTIPMMTQRFDDGRARKRWGLGVVLGGLALAAIASGIVVVALRSRHARPAVVAPAAASSPRE